MFKMLALAATAAVLTAGVVSAEEQVAAAKMEKCKVVREGKGLIKAAAADGVGDLEMAGQNKAGDINAWIMVPEGQCGKINAGDFSGVDAATKSKIEG